MKKRSDDSQRGFISMYMLAIIVGVLLITGAGQYLWRNTLQLGSFCHEVIAELGIYELDDMCMGIGTSLASLKNELNAMVGATHWGDTMDIEDFAGMVAREFSSNFGFNAPQLSGFIDPGGLSTGSLSNLSSSLTMGSMGSNMLSSGNTGLGLQYLTQSANMGEVGVLSQISLGNAYLNGTGGVPKDLGAAYRYNSMALDSINKLQGSGSPGSKQLLGALPAAPSDMTASLRGALGQIKSQMK